VPEFVETTYRLGNSATSIQIYLSFQASTLAELIVQDQFRLMFSVLGLMERTVSDRFAPKESNAETGFLTLENFAMGILLALLIA